jgi:exosortase
MQAKHVIAGSRERVLGNSDAVFALVPAMLAFTWLVSKAQWFWSNQPDLQFGWVVLMLCLYLFWEAWESRPMVAFRWRAGWVLLTAIGCGTMFLVQVYEAAFGTKAASVLVLAIGVMAVISGNLGYVYGGPGVRRFGFPVLFLLVALPMPSVVHAFIVGGLQSKVTALNVEILNLIGIPAHRAGSVIRLPTCTVGVDEACSGIRSLQSTIMATLFIGHLSFKSSPLKVILVVVGIGLAILGNLARSLFLSYTANARGVHALESMHDTAGWGILIFTALGVMVLAWMLSRLEKNATLDHDRRSA